ncbi:hypothetical protein [Noviherbaspirillum galbum]|uniref:Uncharacterized protein n=1 Tax=Noviherbaspirillum galbum TaxID=2709383 RepID=A0A6B3SRQ9_9BURK|nr:hypothetical protein [Noviherbaspirillum galbum]NEX63433.1 hypothetical protein [Noviherbaspirillum galbum]
MRQHDWKAGDKAIWRGGDSDHDLQLFPAVVLEHGLADVKVEILLRLGDNWAREVRHVQAATLTPRRRRVAMLDDPAGLAIE